MRIFHILITVIVALGLTTLPVPASAIPSNMHVECISPTVCTSGSTSLVTTGGSTLNLDLISEGGAEIGVAFLGILVPNGPASFSVSLGALETNITFTSGHLGGNPPDFDTNLKEPNLDDFEFNAIVSASAQVGVTATSFEAYDWLLGPYNSPGGGAAGIAAFTISPLPDGTVIVAWLENSDGNAIERTPLSESLTVGKPPTVPEPATILLLGCGLFGMTGYARMRMKK